MKTAAFVLVALLPAVACAERAPNCLEVKDGFGPAGQVAVRTETVATGLEVPWALAFLPGGDVLVTERPGRLRLLHDGKLVPEPVATVPVDPGGEGGLQGLALHPKFAENRLFFIYFTTVKDGRKVNRLERWQLAADHRSARFESRLLDDLDAAQYHHGGRIRVGPDGMLYVSVGDAHHADNGQDATTLNGKILRLTPDGKIPADNPDPKSAIFLRGVRNSEGFDWLDARTLAVTDHGPTREHHLWAGADEVNLAHAGDNLGWPLVHLCDAHAGTVAPLLTWDEAVPPGGAAFYTGDAIPEWKGSLLVGALKTEHLHRVVFTPDHTRVALHEAYFVGALGRIREVQMGPDGALWLTTSNCDGRGRCGADKDVIVRVLPK